MVSGQTIFLYGPPGSGKSTIGQELARQLDREFVDLDLRIEEKAGKTIPEIFKLGFRFPLIFLTV